MSSMFSSIVSMKCPNCHEGDLFPTKTFSYQKPFDMHQECPNCGENYWPEPGFYYGAMFISYIFWAWMSVIIGGIAIMVFGLSVNQATLVLIGVTAILFVWLFRISRSIWIHIAPIKRKKKGNTGS